MSSLARRLGPRAWFAAAVLVVTLGPALRAAAQEAPAVAAPLADRVPADALLYVGWAGAADAKQQFAGSHAEALLSASNVPQMFEQTFPRLGEAMARRNPAARPWDKFATEIAPILFRHPTAVAFGGVDWEAQPNPLPRVLLVCDAGEEAAVLRVKLTELFQMAKQVGLVTLMDVQDGVLYLNLGWQRLDLAMAGGGGAASLATDPRFTAAMTGLIARPTTAAFLDVPGLAILIEEGTRRDKGEAEVVKFRQFMEATGLRGLGSVAVTQGFADGLYHTAAFAETRGPRTGLLELLDGKPLDEAVLRAVPADAGLVAAGRADLTKLLTFARNAIVVTNPSAAGDFEQGLKFINMLVGADIERDLLEATGESWAAYAAPGTGGGLLGAVAVNKPDSPERVRAALTSLSLSLVSLTNQNLREQNKPFRVTGRQVELDGGDVYYLDLPGVAPAWRVAGAYAYFGLYPQSVVSAPALAGGDAFPASSGYAAVRAMAGDRPIRGLFYADLPQYAGQSYGAMNAYVQLASGLLAGFGETSNLTARVPPMLLPDYATLRQHLTPILGVSWTDDRGLHVRASEPFPLSGVLLLGAAR